MNGISNLGDHQPLMQQRAPSNTALNGMLTSNGYSIQPAENQRRSVDLGEMARRGANIHLNGHTPLVYPGSAASRTGSDTSTLFAQDQLNFSVNQNDSLHANRGRMGAFNPSSAADAARLLLSGGAQRGRAALHNLGPATAPYQSALYHPTDGLAPLQPQFPAGDSQQQGYAGLVARMALQRAGVRPQRTSLDMPPHAPLNGQPRRYSVDIAGGYSPALPNPVPVAEAALIAGPDGYSRIAALNNYRGMGGAGDGLAHEEGYVNGFTGYQDFVDPALHTPAPFSHGPDMADYGVVPNAEPAGFVSLRDELAFDALDPTPRARQNGRTHMNGAAGGCCSCNTFPHSDFPPSCCALDCSYCVFSVNCSLWDVRGYKALARLVHKPSSRESNVGVESHDLGGFVSHRCHAGF